MSEIGGIDWPARLAELLAYGARFDSDLLQAIVGATPDDVRIVASTWRLSLPADYEAFLLAMGRTPLGSLGSFMEHLIFGVDAINAFYLEPPVPVPGDAVYLWTFQEDSPFYHFLPVTEPETAACPVVELNWRYDPDTDRYVEADRRSLRVADSLLQYLWEEAFRKLRRPALPLSVTLREREHDWKPDEERLGARLAHFHDIARHLGFAPLPFSRPRPSLYDRDDAALSLYSDMFAEDKLVIDAGSERELVRLREVMADSLGLYWVR
ncbi:MAG: hypothetical protein AB7I59_17720 [Geminicoccaceae bacterium]